MYIMSLRAKAAGAQQVDDLDEAGLVGADEAVAHGEVDHDERRVGLPQRELVADALTPLSSVPRTWLGVGRAPRLRQPRRALRLRVRRDHLHLLEEASSK